MIVGTLLPRSGYASPSKGKGRLVDSEDEDTDNELEITNSKNESVLGWAYIGSHNFTPSAWGTLSGSSSKPILNVRKPSFECSFHAWLTLLMDNICPDYQL